jgi:hypothetical protein
MSNILARLFGGEPGGAAAGETIVAGNYDPSKRGTPKQGSGLIKPSRNMGSSSASSFSSSSAPAPAPSTNMGSTIVPGNLKTSMNLTSANIAKAGTPEDKGIFGGLFGGRRRSRASRRNKNKSRKNRSRRNKNKGHKSRK